MISMMIYPMEPVFCSFLPSATWEPLAPVICFVSHGSHGGWVQHCGTCGTFNQWPYPVWTRIDGLQIVYLRSYRYDEFLELCQK